MDKTLLLLLFQVILFPIIIKAQWPCPEEADIAPCVCLYDDKLFTLDLNCSNITDDAALVNVFKASFPFQKFNEFRIGGTAQKPVLIENFTSDIFGDIYFQSIYINNTTLTRLIGDPFAKSQNSLQRVDMANNKLLIYPFDTLEKYTQLTYLRLAHNNLQHMADITSPYLINLNVNFNPELKYGDQAFHYATNLRTLNLRNIGLTNIAPNTFRPMIHLKTLDLSDNNIHILWKDSFLFSSMNLTSVTISRNILDTIEEGAIGFCKPNGLNFTECFDQQDAKVPTITIQNNSLTDLPKDVWEKSFSLPAVANNGQAIFDFWGNPIKCGCNIAWLVTNPNYFPRVHPNSTCDNGDLFGDLDPLFFEVMCIAPSTVSPSYEGLHF